MFSLGHMSSAILTLPMAEAERLATLDEQALGYEIAVWFSCRLGAMQVASARHVPSLPLSASFDLEISSEFHPEDQPRGLLILR